MILKRWSVPLLVIVLFYSGCAGGKFQPPAQPDHVDQQIQHAQEMLDDMVASGVLSYPQLSDFMPASEVESSEPRGIRYSWASQHPDEYKQLMAHFDKLEQIQDIRVIPVLARFRGLRKPIGLGLQASRAIERIHDEVLARKLSPSYRLPIDEQMAADYWQTHQTELESDTASPVLSEDALNWAYYKLLSELGDKDSDKEERYDRTKHGTKVSDARSAEYQWLHELRKRGDYQKAFKLAKRMRKSPEKYPRGAYEVAGLLMGRCYVEQGRYQDAIRIYSEVVPTGCCGTTSFPRKIHRHSQLGRCFEAIGLYEQAIRHYMAAISIHGNALMYFNDILIAERGLSRLGVDLERAYLGMLLHQRYDAAISGLARKGSDRAVVRLIALYHVSSDRGYLQQDIVRALGMIGYQQQEDYAGGRSDWGQLVEQKLSQETRANIRQCILAAMDNPDDSVRQQAEHALSYIGGP